MEHKWWHDKVAYQIYPKSFCDSNGDGVGDLPGIISKLDYLKDLGVDIIWLSPVYKSPFVDQGYDVADYYAIDPLFGTMEDFDRLLAEAKKRDMHILMDLVVNHCSDQHEWFQKALQDPYGKYGDYFYFRKGKDGKAPSNYRGYFGGSTWEPVPGYKDLYYFHMFAKEQPDLNWYNPAMKKEIFDMVNWWLDKGLAGFRIDAIINIAKVLDFPDYPADGPDGLSFCTNMVEQAQGVGDLLQELKRNTFAKHDAFTIGEVFNMKPGELESFIGDQGHFSCTFDFGPQIMFLGGHGWYDAPQYEFKTWRKVIFDGQAASKGIGYQANIIENHDEPRGVSRYLPEHAQNNDGVKMLGTVSVLLRGLPFLFQGQEIGMRNCPVTSVEQYNDINTKDQYQVALDAGCSEQEALEACMRFSRDNGRTPMQWSAAPNAGFTTGEPWLMVNPNYTEINVENQEKQPDSVLNYYKQLLKLRKSHPVFTVGDITPMFLDMDTVMAYIRSDGDKSVLVAANFGTEPVTLPVRSKAVLLQNLPAEIGAETITLAPCGVIVTEL